MRSSCERIGFFVSALTLAFMLGWGARFFGWFPDALLETSARQAHRLLSPPSPSFAAPRVYPRRGAQTFELDRVQPGLTLVASFWKDRDWLPGLRLIDRRGRVLHEWIVNPAELFGSDGGRESPRPGAPDHVLAQHAVHGSYLFPSGDVLLNVEGLGAVRLDACSRPRWTLPERTHHSIARADDGTFWIPSGTESDSLERGLSAHVYRDRILRVSEGGDIVDGIDVLSVLFQNGLERHLARAQHTAESPIPGRVDLTHLNDVEPLSASKAGAFPMFEAGDLLVSLRNVNLVLVVDPESQRVKWHRDGPWIQQHDPDFLSDGSIGVFDNARDGTERGTLLGGSRIVAVEPGVDSWRVLLSASDSDTLYSEILGKWQRLSNGNLLVTEGAAGRVLEVTPDGETVWEWIASPYSATEVPHVFEGTRYDLSPSDVARWPSCRNHEGEGE